MQKSSGLMHINNEPMHDRHTSFRPSTAVRKLQLVRAGSNQFGIPAEGIAAIAAWRQPTPLPFAPDSVLGVVSIQGRILTVLDLAILTRHESDAVAGPARHLIALRGDEQLALAVEELGQEFELDEDALSAKQDNGDPLILRVVHHEGTTLTVLNSKELFPTALHGRERRRRRF